MSKEKFPLRLLRTWCPDHLYDEIAGDLIQRYERDFKSVGKTRAAWRLFWNTVRFFRPGIVFRNRFTRNTDWLDMMSHFFKVFFRASFKDRSYTFINVSGLAIGLATAIFILLWCLDELSFDEFHVDKARIYQVMGNHAYPDNVTTIGSTSGRIGPALKELPEVEETCRQVDFPIRKLFSSSDKNIYELGTYADPSIFKIFTLPLVEGNVRNPLPDNASIAISRTLAEKYFDYHGAVGKIIRLNNETDVKVTAVYENLPGNSSLQFEFILPYDVYAKNDLYNEEWGAWTGGNTYVKVRAGTDISALNKKIDVQFTKPHIWPRWDTNVELFLFSMRDWRLRNQFENGKQSGGRILYVETFGAVAVFILLIACFNFMNLATARSVSRSKEVGVRKVVGAGRGTLVSQFMLESLLTSLISVGFSLVIVYFMLPYFNDLTGKHLTVPDGGATFWLCLLAMVVIAGLIAGSYPALFLSSIKAIQVLKGKFSNMTGSSVRKGLVVFQFGLSVILIVSAVVMYRQIEYLRNKDLGFDRNHTFYLRINDALSKDFEEFKRIALADPSIRFVSRSDDNPMDVFGGLVLADNAWPGKTKEDNLVFQFLQCDYDLLPALGFSFVAGRNFSPDFKSDSSNYIITEEAARVMRLKDPVGQFLNGPTKGTIIGVIKDFHSAGMQKPIMPVIIGLNLKEARRIYVSYEKGKLPDALKHITAVHHQIAPDFPMEYKFLDEPFEEQYRNEILMGKLAGCFTCIAIFISCLGLFGLSSFNAARRSREISIRRVLGASLSQVVALLCRDFIVLILVALMIGIPVAWMVMERFLATFAFHTDIGLPVLIATTVLMVLVALVTVSFQSIRSALANPVESLKNE